MLAKKLLNDADAVKVIRQTVGDMTHAEFGKLHGFTGETVGVILRGARPPAKAVLRACGLRRVNRYERVEDAH